MEMKKLTKAIRMTFRDVAFPFRMGAGFAGDVNRTHPCSILPNLINTVTPPTAYGQAVVNDGANAVRPLAAADNGLTTIWGVTVRPFPIQQAAGGAAAAFGSIAPPVSGVIDVLLSGIIMVKLNAGSPVKGGAVFVWCAATNGVHIQGGFEMVAGGGNNTAALDVTRYQYNGPPDSAGIVEIVINP